MAGDQPFPPGARGLPRPTHVVDCPGCGEPAARGYPDCPECVRAVDKHWAADWAALLGEHKVALGGSAERELAHRVLTAPVGRFPWTCVDWAMTRRTCTDCGAELGTGPLECVPCTVADGNRWAWDHQGHPWAMTGNEHALREGRVVLRAPHRHRPTVVAGWRLILPFLLVGELPTNSQARRIRQFVLSGRYVELSACRSLAEMASLPALPWRHTG